jgi:hypothetical protein
MFTDETRGYMDEDPLGAARGIVIGALIAIAFWAVVATVLWVIW